MNKLFKQVILAVSFTILTITLIYFSFDSSPVSVFEVPYTRITIPTNGYSYGCCKKCRELTVKNILELCSMQMNQSSTSLNQSSTLWCDCETLLARKLIVVTAFSENHFKEATDFLASVQAQMPGTPILVYDLGLSDKSKYNLTTFCGVTVRKFNFSRYPKHIKDLFTCAWKPLVINEMYREYEDGVILYCDASCRLQHSLKPLLPRFSLFPIISGLSDTHLFISTTHDGMMKYLQLNKTRKEYASIGKSLQAGAEIFWLNQELNDKFLKYWVDCSLHKECISPKGSIVYPCNFSRMKEGVYACHRYDQAAFNAILTREFGFEFVKDMAKNSFNEYFKIERHPTVMYKIKKGKECNLT